VYLILTGYCDVVMFDGTEFQTIASLQAGEIIGEMAIVTGALKRNASVVASSSVTVMVFSEENLNDFVVREGFRDKLLKRWEMRTELKKLPQFEELISTVLEKVSALCEVEIIAAGQERIVDDDYWYILDSGKASFEDIPLTVGDELGIRPFSSKVMGKLKADSDCCFIRFPIQPLSSLLQGTPQFNYLLRKYRVSQNDPAVDWLRGAVMTK